MRISNFFYKIESNDVSARVVVLADIHYYSKKDLKKLNRVLNEVKNHKPNYICIPGDMIDQKFVKDEDCFTQWLKNLGQIAPVIISLGNHELIVSKKDYYNYDKNFFKTINRIPNVYFLDNQIKKINSINFIGLSLPGEYYYDLKERDKKYLIDYINKHLPVIGKGYNILLCHTPIELLKYDVYNNLNISKHVSLVICGHMHGGIMPNIFKKYLKGRGLISPNRGIFVKHSYGYYKIGNTNFIISSGITKSSHRNKLSFLDFLFSPEITIVDIKGRFE